MKRIALLTTLPLLAALTGCVPNHPANSVTVTMTDESCVVEPATAPAGPTTFNITNSGTDVNEFEIVAADKSTIITEKENVGPGTTVKHVVDLQPGEFFTGCKFQQVGTLVGLAAFTVTGEANASAAALTAAQQAAVDAYLSYIRAQVDTLETDTQAFTAAYVAGNDELARQLYAPTRAAYERIEPIAEAFGDLDPRIDYREVDALAEGLNWTGFHRIEKDLWPPAAGALNADGTDAHQGWTASTPAERQQIADALNADIAELQTLINSEGFSLAVADISNGAIALLDEVASGKITGEEEWWSGTDLYDVQANVEGAYQAFILVAPLANDTALVSKIQAGFDKLNVLLATYGSIATAYPSYGTLSATAQKALSDAVNALSEPLSQLTAEVLGTR